ncbi:MAG: hypothetical protein K2W95_15525 [Candidatus Obscuribacterales bacterium]|nr:hypothetical protein [Candidatus Obscuribacterales bacterium]
MALVKKLSRHGHSFALIIEKSILELLNIDETTVLSITTDKQNRIIVTPIRETKQDDRQSNPN